MQRRARPFHPPASKESYKDVLIFEERLKQNNERLQRQRRKYEAFLITLIAVIAYLGYLVFLVPSIYSLVHYGNVAMLLVAVTTLVLFFATGMYSEKIAYAHKFVPQANRALRPFNIYLNTRHPSSFAFLNPFRSTPSPASSTLSRTPSGRSIASDLSSPPLSRRTSSSSVMSNSSSSAASFRSGGALRSPSVSPPSSPPLGTQPLPSPPPSPTIDDGPVTRAPIPSPSSLPAPARGVPIPPIPPAQNPRGELIFSSRVLPQFREGYERYRGEWEKRRAEARRLQREQQGGWGWWVVRPWAWRRSGSRAGSRTASPSPAPGPGGKGGRAGGGAGTPREKDAAETEDDGEKILYKRVPRSREPSAAPSDYSVGTAGGDGEPFPPSRTPSPEPTAPGANGGYEPWPRSDELRSPSVSPILSSTSTPASTAPPSRSPSPTGPSASSSSHPLPLIGAPNGSPGRIRAESFSELLTMETDSEQERGPLRSPMLERSESRRSLVG